jgi:hypothetical protein
MKRGSAFIAMGALLVSLGIFVLYRSEGCAVNLIANVACQMPFLTNLRGVCQSNWPASDFFVYQLPGGLWVLAATLASWNGPAIRELWRFNMSHLPLTVAIGLEVFQKMGITDGTFDVGDIVAAYGGFCVAKYLGEEIPGPTIPITTQARRLFCFGSCLLLFLADHYP